MIGCGRCGTIGPSQPHAHVAVSKEGTLRRTALLYLVLKSTQVGVNEAVDADVTYKRFIHSLSFQSSVTKEVLSSPSEVIEEGGASQTAQIHQMGVGLAV